MQVRIEDWIVGGVAPDVSTPLQVAGAQFAGVQVVGPVTSAAYLQGSIDGINWENLARVQVDGSGPSQLAEVGLLPVGFVRVAVADEAGDTVSVSVVLSD